jgi:hypothetical protein
VSKVNNLLCQSIHSRGQANLNLQIQQLPERECESWEHSTLLLANTKASLWLSVYTNHQFVWRMARPANLPATRAAISATHSRRGCFCQVPEQHQHTQNTKRRQPARSQIRSRSTSSDASIIICLARGSRRAKWASGSQVHFFTYANMPNANARRTWCTLATSSLLLPHKCLRKMKWPGHKF